jgi:hypothetical protein
LLWCCPHAPLVTAALLSAARASDYRIPPARRRRRQSHSVSARSSPARVSSASVLCPASGFASRQRLGSERAEEFLLALVPRTRWRCLRRQAVLITRGFRPTATGTLCGVLLAGWPAPFASHVSRQRFCAPVVLVVSCYMCPAVPGVSCCPLHPGGCCRGPLVVRPPVVSDHCFEFRIRLTSLFGLHLFYNILSFKRYICDFCCSE